jgi:UDP-N-acetylglucosamine 2-epimerase (non-hydrolysing)
MAKISTKLTPVQILTMRQSQLNKKVLICFGTRPEAIKLAPVVKEFKRRDAFDVRICVTSQHREMLDQVLEIFEISPDYDLDLMTPGQSLESLTAKVIESMSSVMEKETPDFLVVQGDTTTTFAAALAAFYKKVSVVHVEAGLRTYQKFSPFPEELNRQMTSRLTDWHFAPTERAREALLKENVPGDRVFMVGNTVIDALLSLVEKARTLDLKFKKQFEMIDFNKRLLLITGHRRENFGQGFKNVCHAIKMISQANPDLEIVYPVHLNPHVQEPVKKILSGLSNVHLILPQDYLTFVWLLEQSFIVLTDSGGVQEEAPSLGKPVLVTRDTTERGEAIDAGVARLVGTNTDQIVHYVQRLLDESFFYQQMSRPQNPYGDGKSAGRIADVLEKEVCLHSFNSSVAQSLESG